MNIYSLSIFVDTMNLILGINEVRMNFIRTILLTLTIIFIIDKFKEKNKNAKLYLFLFIIYQTIICIVTTVSYTHLVQICCRFVHNY